MAKKKVKLQKIDGLGPYEKKKLRDAIRQVWHRSFARKLCVERHTGKDGFKFCGACKKKTPDLKIDHMVAVGEVDEGFIERMFVSSKHLRGLCKKCHQVKTNAENQKRRAKEKERKQLAELFDSGERFD